MSKGKILSRTDLGFAVITCDSVRWKIYIDEERQVYHLKVGVCVLCEYYVSYRGFIRRI